MCVLTMGFPEHLDIVWNWTKELNFDYHYLEAITAYYMLEKAATSETS